MKILILEDNIDVVNALKQAFQSEGYSVEYLLSKESVLEKIEEFSPNLITLDLSFGDEKDTTGIDILRDIRESYPNVKELPVFVISGTITPEKMKQLRMLGINGYFLKPISDHALLLEKIKNCIPDPEIIGECIDYDFSKENMIGKSPELIEVTDKICNAALAQSNVLIIGENGTGKEVLAKYYQEVSPRKNKPFVPIDCTTLKQETFESELFGHVKGSYTGAVTDKMGKIEEADGGIVFLDEIGELPLAQQAKLLRLIQHKTFTRMGASARPKTVDVVFVFATNRQLPDLVHEGLFRIDLYQRLKINKIEAPPLRERLTDIPLLVQYFIQMHNQKTGKNVQGVSEEVMQRYLKYSWPGNVRELKNSLETGLVRCAADHIAAVDIQDTLETQNTDAEKRQDKIDWDVSYQEFKAVLDIQKRDMEREYYTHHLEKHNWNKSKTAKAIGMAVAYLNETLKRLELKKPK